MDPKEPTDTVSKSSCVEGGPLAPRGNSPWREGAPEPPLSSWAPLGSPASGEGFGGSPRHPAWRRRTWQEENGIPLAS